MLEVTFGAFRMFVWMCFFIYILCRLCKWLGREEPPAVEVEDPNVVRDRWERTVAYSPREEHELYEASCSNKRYWLMQEDALKVIRSLPGLEYARFKDKGVAQKDYNSCQIVRVIEAVKHGRVPRSVTYMIPPLELALDMNVPGSAYVEFGRWVERTIQENGAPEARLYAQKYNGYKSFIWEPYMDLFGKTGSHSTSSDNVRVTSDSFPEMISLTSFSEELCAELNAAQIARNIDHFETMERFRRENEKREKERTAKERSRG